MDEIKSELTKDMSKLQKATKKEYKLNGKSEIYLKLVDEFKELNYFRFMINKYERKIRLKKQ